MTAEVHHGDALELVPDLGEFDAVITDPPYPTGGESSMSDPASIKEAREMVDGMCQSLIAGVLRAVRRRRGSGETLNATAFRQGTEAERFSVWMFTDWRQVSFFSSVLRGQALVSQSCIVWDKGKGNMSALYHPSHEMVLFARTRGKQSDALGFLGRDLIQCPTVRGKGKMHPFDKPVELVEKMLSGFRTGRILDPFCGAGSLLVGAQRLGWDVVGIDISREFVDIARTRLGNGTHKPARQRVEGQEELL